ncbi:MAG: hypothetical protein AB1425_07835 [Actinomycetota bacterium]
MFRLYVVLILAAELAALTLIRPLVPDLVVYLLAPLVPLTLVAAIILHSRPAALSYRSWRLSPERIVKYRETCEKTISPEEISRSIVERATEIRRALSGSPSEVQIEMCALGYRACANDMITLTHMINEEYPRAGFLRRLKLRRARGRATDALASARRALPPGALRATRQEQQ